MNYDTIIVSKEEAIGIITLNRPEALNALNTKMVTELIDALGSFEKDDLIRCVVITGNESAFSAGEGRNDSPVPWGNTRRWR